MDDDFVIQCELWVYLNIYIKNEDPRLPMINHVRSGNITHSGRYKIDGSRHFLYVHPAGFEFLDTLNWC